MDALEANEYVSSHTDANEAKSSGRRGKGALSRISASSDNPTLQSIGKAVASYHRGGKVRKTGLARLKKGERVLTKGQQKRLMGRGKRR